MTATEPINITADVEHLARAMQTRDARTFGHVVDGVQHPTWNEVSDDGQKDYRNDAHFAISVLLGIRGYRTKEDA